MTKTWFLILILPLLAAACNAVPADSYVDGTADLAGQTVRIEVARSVAERTQGLSGRESISAETGMLFIFDAPGKQGFWMKDMKFNIDIVWIKDGQVVDISANALAQPGASDYELTIYQPKADVDMVLELESGWAAKNGLKIGDTVAVKLKQ